MDLPKTLNRNGGRKPSLRVQARTIPEAWEKAIIDVWDNGVDIETDYDVGGAQEPPSREAAVLIDISHPMKEPRIHKNYPEGVEGLQKYDMEVRFGIHDHWVKIKKDDGSPIWDYSYHERLFAWPTYDKNGNQIRVNQVEDLIQKLVRERHITKSGLAISWLPTSDHTAGHSPCLQMILCRLIPDEKGILHLNMDTTFRSRDNKNALFENIYAFTNLQKDIADDLSDRLGEEVKVGSYIDFSNSLHIYGRDFNPYKILAPEHVRDLLNTGDKERLTEKLRTGPPITGYEKFLDLIEKMKRQPLEDRVWNTEDVKEIMEEERVRLLADPDYTRKSKDTAEPKLIKEHGSHGKITGVELPNGTILTYEPGKDKLNQPGGILLLPNGRLYKPELLMS